LKDVPASAKSVAKPIAKIEPKAEVAAKGKLAKAEAEKTVVARSGARDVTHPSGWVVQIGATDDVAKANALIAKARAASRGSLASAQSYTEKVQKGDSTLHRARFAGLAEGDAQQACRDLKRSGIACFATKN
jgi:D-alanyl-D-alanine carboxypeptidase